MTNTPKIPEQNGETAPAEALSRNKPATPFTPEEIEALTALAYHSAQAQRNTLLAGMAGAADQLVAERATLLARVEAAEGQVSRARELVQKWEERGHRAMLCAANGGNTLQRESWLTTGGNYREAARDLRAALAQAGGEG